MPLIGCYPRHYFRAHIASPSKNATANAPLLHERGRALESNSYHRCDTETAQSHDWRTVLELFGLDHLDTSRNNERAQCLQYFRPALVYKIYQAAGLLLCQTKISLAAHLDQLQREQQTSQFLRPFRQVLFCQLIASLAHRLPENRCRLQDRPYI